MTIPLFSGREPTAQNQNTTNDLVTQQEHSIAVGMAESPMQTLLNELSEAKRPAQPLVGALSAAKVRNIQAIQNEINVVDTKSLIQIVSNQIGEPTPATNSVVWTLTIDGVSEKSRVETVHVSLSEESVHNSITFTTIDRDLFNKCDPTVNSGMSRVTLTVGSRTFYFLIEKRSGGQYSFAIWGRGLTAQDDYPHTEGVAYASPDPRRASSIGNDVCSRSMSWSGAVNWVLPAHYHFEGSPTELLVDLASRAGAVVRSSDAGDFRIRKKWTVSPQGMAMGSTGVARFNKSDIITDISHSMTKGKGFDEIIVYGKSAEIVLADLETDGVVYRGSTFGVKCYWNGCFPFGLPEIYASDGRIYWILNLLEVSPVNRTSGGLPQPTFPTPVSSAHIEELTEYVTFRNSVGSLSKPLSSLVSAEWQGASLGGITTYPNNKMVRASAVVQAPHFGYGVCKIKYKAKYHKMLVSGASSGKVALVVFQTTGKDVAVRVRSGQTWGENPMDAVNDEFLTEKHVCSIRGQQELYDVAYDMKRFSFEVPYNANVVDGEIIGIDDPEIGYTGKFKVIKADISIIGPKVTNVIEAIQCQV